MDYDKKWDNRLTFTVWEVACLIHHIDPDKVTESYLAVNMPKQFNKLNLSRKELISYIGSDANKEGYMASRDDISAWFDSKSKPCPEIFKSTVKSEFHAVSKTSNPEGIENTKQLSAGDVSISINPYKDSISVIIGGEKRKDLTNMSNLVGRIKEAGNLLTMLADGKVTSLQYKHSFKGKDRGKFIQRINDKLREELNLTSETKPLQVSNKEIVCNLKIALEKDKDLLDVAVNVLDGEY